MRNILFRAKRTDNGEWVEGGGILRTYENNGTPKEEVYIIRSGSEFRCGTDEFGNIVAIGDALFCAVNPDTVCEWTGLTDKNGEKIFDGDVVDGADFQADDGYAKIRWDDDAARFVILGYGLVCDFDNYYGHELEVIGNIYDNPDLIEW